MKCIDEQQLWEYIDGEMIGTERVVMESHLDKCPDCQKELDLLITLDGEFSNIVTAQPSVRFTKNVMELIEIEVTATEYQPLLHLFWKRFIVVSFIAMILTLVVVAIAFPVSGTLPFETELKTVSMGLGWMLGLLQNQLLFNSVVIILAFWLLYGFDKWLASSSIAK